MLLEERVEVGNPFADILEGRLHRFFEDVCCTDHERHGNQYDQRKPPIGVKHNAEDHDQLEEVANNLYQPLRKDIGNGFKVGYGAGNQPADGCAVKLLEPHAHDVVEHI